jgi:hypothetical protein
MHPTTYVYVRTGTIFHFEMRSVVSCCVSSRLKIQKIKKVTVQLSQFFVTNWWQTKRR